MPEEKECVKIYTKSMIKYTFWLADKNFFEKRKDEIPALFRLNFSICCAKVPQNLLCSKFFS